MYFVLSITKVQRGITQTIYIQELWVLQSACRLMLINISMTFHEDILERFSSFRATERRASYSVLGIVVFVQKGITKKYISKSYGSCDLHIVLCWLIFL